MQGLAIARKRSTGGHLLAETRRRALEEHLKSAGSVSVAEIEERFSVSPMTARRDLTELERRGVVRRTHGGAVVAEVSAREDSFARRVNFAGGDKRPLAGAPLATPSETQAGFPG